jgi:hypothetical protein
MPLTAACVVACTRTICAVAMVAASILITGGCVELSPFDSDLDEDERDQNARNLERLAA